jgi:hypothetical protein
MGNRTVALLSFNCTESNRSNIPCQRRRICRTFTGGRKKRRRRWERTAYPPKPRRWPHSIQLVAEGRQRSVGRPQAGSGGYPAENPLCKKLTDEMLSASLFQQFDAQGGMCRTIRHSD